MSFSWVGGIFELFCDHVMIPCNRRLTVVRLSFHRRSTVVRPSGDRRVTVGNKREKTEEEEEVKN